MRSSVIGTVEKRGCLEAKGWMYKKSMFSQFFIHYFIVILVQNRFSVSLTIDLYTASDLIYRVNNYYMQIGSF